MTHRETHDLLLMVLALCNNFLGPVAGTLRAAAGALRSLPAGLRGGALEDAVQMIDRSIWQLDRLGQAMRRYYSVYMPECEAVDAAAPVAAAVRETNVMSYNMRPAVARFPAPATVDGVRSWEALRQPADYLAFFKAGEHGNWLCRVECSESAVLLRHARTGEPVPVPEHARLRWLGRNMEVTLRSGVRSYVSVFVVDRRPPPGRPTKAEFEARYEVLMDLNWPKALIDRYLRFHGELPPVE
eukprot:jgi/Tetstr1/464211/TSEL_009016.t1